MIEDEYEEMFKIPRFSTDDAEVSTGDAVLFDGEHEDGENR